MEQPTDTSEQNRRSSATTLVITALLTPLLFVALAAVASADSPVSPDADPEPLFGCPGFELVIHNVDCELGTADAFADPSPAGTPDLTRYGCAGGDLPLAPWCDRAPDTASPTTDRSH